MSGEKAAAELTVRKAGRMPFQEVIVVDADLAAIARVTLTDSEPRLVLELRPGLYVVEGMAPSGSRSRTRVLLEAGAAIIVDAVGDEETSSRSGSASAAEESLPESDLALPRAFAHGSPKRSVSALRSASPAESLAMPTPESFSELTTGRVARELDRRAETGNRPNRNSQRKHDVSLRTYVWCRDSLRWLRSGLIDHARGDYSLEATHLTFPPRPELPPEFREAIHLLGAFAPGRPARFIALPLFDAGVELFTHLRRVSGEQQALSAAASDSSIDVSWHLAAVDPELDALLQAINGRAFGNRDAIGDKALRFADRVLSDKRRDPEAATVAGYFLQQYRRLDRRAEWVDNLARWFPWSPDALVLGAWGNLVFDTGDDREVCAKLAAVYRAGPPQLAPARRILRDLVSLNQEDPDSTMPATTRAALHQLWERIGRETRREVAGGPFYSFVRHYGH